MIYLNLFGMFFKIGLFGFGGGIALLPLIYQTVHSLNGMTHAEFADLVGIAQVTPGPIGINAATYAGFDVAGVLGGIIASIGVAVPSFIIVTLVSSALRKYRESKWVKGIFRGLRPATIGLIASASVIVAKGALISPFACIMCVVAFVAMFKTKINPIWIVLSSGAIGAILYGVII